jgi:DNA-binding ferritin-like protein
MLKRPITASSSYSPAQASGCETMVAEVVSELMNAATAFHKLHLKVQGVGSFAAHKALNELYDALPDHADALAEGYQGAAECILSCPDSCPKTLYSVEEAVSYLRELKEVISQLQAMMPYSEIVNQLDTIKDTVNSSKYKLLFLK